MNIQQTKDIYGYITQFCPIHKFNTDEITSTLTRSLFAIMYSFKYLWQIFDNKK